MPLRNAEAAFTISRRVFCDIIRLDNSDRPGEHMYGFLRNFPEENLESYMIEKHCHNYERAFFLARLSFVSGIILLAYAFLIDDVIEVKAGFLVFSFVNGIFWLATLNRPKAVRGIHVSYERFVICGELILLPIWSMLMASTSRSTMAAAFYITIGILVVAVFFVVKWQTLAMLYTAAFVVYLVAGQWNAYRLMDLSSIVPPFLFVVISFNVSRISHRRFIESFDIRQVLRQRNVELETLLEAKAAELKDSERHVAYDIIKTLIKILEYYDEYTKGHSEHVANLSRSIAIEMGMDIEAQEEIYLCGLVHDIGKLNVPHEILNKPAHLSNEEKKVMKHHSNMSYNLLADSKSLQRIAYIVQYHHEHWDGNGYPLGVKHDKIPLESQIIMVADAWDAMRSTRVYRKAMSLDSAIEQLKVNSGTQFSPDVVDALLRLVAEGRIA